MRAVRFTYAAGRRIVIAIVGASVLVLGVIMIVTPGPAIIVIPFGLAILALEFMWARQWLKKLRQLISQRGAAGRAKRADEYH